MLRKFLAANIECIEGIRAIGTVFKQVFLRFRILFHRLGTDETSMPPVSKPCFAGCLCSDKIAAYEKGYYGQIVCPCFCPYSNIRAFIKYFFVF